MKIVLALFCLTISTPVLAQQPAPAAYVHLSKSINDDGKTLAIQIQGERENGQILRYNRLFNVTGLSADQREALTNRVLDSLGVASVSEPPRPPEPPVPPAPPQAGTETVTFACETCTGNVQLDVAGNGFSASQTFDAPKDGKPTFPVTLSLNPGTYRLKYWQNKVLQIQASFTVKPGETNVVKVK